MTTQERVREFHQTFGGHVSYWPHFPSVELSELRQRLNDEEFREQDDEWQAFVDESKDASLAKLAKELGDLLYVTYGAFVSLGIDGDEVVAEIHRSNMSKLDENRRPILREDGKVLKGPNYKEANIEGVLGRQCTREAA